MAPRLPASIALAPSSGNSRAGKPATRGSRERGSGHRARRPGRGPERRPAARRARAPPAPRPRPGAPRGRARRPRRPAATCRCRPRPPGPAPRPAQRRRARRGRPAPGRGRGCAGPAAERRGSGPPSWAEAISGWAAGQPAEPPGRRCPQQEANLHTRFRKQTRRSAQTPFIGGSTAGRIGRAPACAPAQRWVRPLEELDHRVPPGPVGGLDPARHAENPLQWGEEDSNLRRRSRRFYRARHRNTRTAWRSGCDYALRDCATVGATVGALGLGPEGEMIDHESRPRIATSTTRSKGQPPERRKAGTAARLSVALRRRLALRRQQHLVDDVDGPVGGTDVGLDDLR